MLGGAPDGPGAFVLNPLFIETYMNQSSNQGGPTAYAETPKTKMPVPYAFERVQADSDGGEVARLEAQNMLFLKTAPLDQLPPLPPDAAILDVGSGTGFWAMRLAARVPRGAVTCLDRSLELLGLARRRLDGMGPARFVYLNQDLRSLDLAERAFDLVFTSVTLAHVQELEITLARLVRALKPGGWLACFEPTMQARHFCEVHPPCPNFAFLMNSVLEVVEERGSDLSVGLKVAHHLDRMGLDETVLRSFGTALHGEDVATCIREVFLPLVRSYLRHRWEPRLLEQRLEAASQEAATPNLWMDFRRTVVLGRRPA